jgi:hypothetical protein
VCWSASDNFNRSDSPTIGNWIKASGTWAIESNQLKSTGLGLVYYDTPMPKMAYSCLTTVVCKNIQIGNEYILFCNRPWAAGGYEGVKLTINTATECGIEWVNVGGGAGKSPLSHDGLGTDITLSLCRSQTGIYAQISTASYFLWACVPMGPPGGLPFFGLENPTGNTIYFDDWTASEHHATNEKCPLCECECEDWCVPPDLIATFRVTQYHPGYGCPDLDGDSFELDVDDTFQPTVGWRGQGTVSDCGTGETEWDLSLECDAAGPADWILCNYDGTCVDVGWGGAACTGDTAAYPSDWSCGPDFFMTFGPFYIEISGWGVVCEYYIDVTEQ